MELLFTNVRLVRGGTVAWPSWLAVSGEKILAFGAMPSPRPSLAAQAIDAHGAYLCPGFIDVHVHGGGGADFMDASSEAAQTIAHTHARHGTTSLLATTLSAPEGELLAAIFAVREAAHLPVAGARILGIHLEGPYLNPSHRGAQDPRYLREPDLQEAGRLLEAGRGLIRMVTLAPELPGALELITFLRQNGTAPSMSHSDATYDQIQEAVPRGLRHAAHVFNTMRGLHHREPGAVGAILDLPEIAAEMICDGVHLHPAVVRLLFRAKGTGGLILVTDAMRAAGLGDGRFTLGELDVTVSGGIARLGNGALAGSTLTMDAALRNFMAFTGLGLAEALPLVSENPARALGLDGQIGSIEAGQEADLVLLGDDCKVLMTVVGGKIVHQASGLA